MAESPDLRPSPAKRLMFAIIAIAVLVGAGVFLVMLLRSKTPNPVCDHIEEVAKTNPREAENMVDAITVYVMTKLARTNLANGRQQGISDVKGDTPDEKCRSAMSLIDEATPDAEEGRLVDCLSHVTTAKAARGCLGHD